MTDAPMLDRVDPNYPKAKYAPAAEGSGDVKSPAYERIVMRDGQPQRQVEFHPYRTAIVRNTKEEKTLGPEWVDSPADVK